MSFLGWRHRHCPGQEVEVCDETALRLPGTEYLEDGIWRRDDDIMSKEGRIRQLHASVNQCVRTGNLTKPLKGSRTVHQHAQKLSLNFSLSPQTLSLITVGDAVRQLFEEEKVIICPEASFSG